MNTNKQMREPFKGEYPMSAPENNISFINLDQLKEISEGSAAFIEAILNAFKDELTSFLGNFEHELTSSDFASMQQTVHKIKPTGAYIGANSLTLLVGSLEQAVKKSNHTETISLFAQVQSMVKSIFKEIDQHLK